MKDLPKLSLLPKQTSWCKPAVRASLMVALTLASGVTQAISGTTTWTWNSSTGGTPWSTATWTKNPAGGATTPSATTDDIVFAATGRTVSTTTGNIVNQNFTLGSLTYRNEGAAAGNWQVTEIANSVTLTLKGANSNSLTLSVGGAEGSAGSPTVTNTRIFGEGSLVINNSSADIKVGNRYGVATLDLSGLKSFSATTQNFLIGSVGTTVTTSTGAGSIGIVSLAENSQITATLLAVGNNTTSLPSQPVSALHLGKTTVLNVEELRVGSGGSYYSDSSGTLDFNTNVIGQEGVKVTIRGTTGGDSRTNLIIGRAGAGARNQSKVTAIVDFTGGEVDARFNEVMIGGGRGTADYGEIEASLKMDKGTVDAVSVVVGAAINAGASDGKNVEGTLSVAGGAFTAETVTLGDARTGVRQPAVGNLLVSGGLVEITGTGVALTAGKRTATNANATATAFISLTGGTLKMTNGSIAEGGGTVSSSMLLDGGTLDLNGHDVQVDLLTVKKGTIRNAAAISAGGVAGLTKTTGGTLIIEGTNTYTGNTVVQAGTLRVNGALTQSAVLLSEGATLSGTGSVQGLVGGSGTIDPGNSPGLQTVGQLDPTQGLGFNFEFTAKNAAVNWTTPANDLLRITHTTPFTSVLDLDNVISLYLGSDLFANLQDGDTLLGGFYADTGTQLLSFVENATFQIYYEDAGGGISYNGLNYSVANSLLLKVSTVSDTQFSVNGMLTQFTVVPEPTSVAFSMLAGGILLWSVRNRRKARAGLEGK